MKSSRFALGLVMLALAGLWYCAGGSQPPVTANGAEAPERVAAPLTHENLSVYFIHGGDTIHDAQVLTLQEALERELAVVHETSNVNVLAVENRSLDCELFIQSGDIVKGGKQDRMAATDVLLPPNSGVVPLPAHCVEHDRWTGRGTEDARQFKSSYQCAAGKDVIYANLTRNQSSAWANVKSFQDKLSANLGVKVNADASPSSFQLTIESPVLMGRVPKCEAGLKAAGEARDNIIGVVFAVNGEVWTVDVYGSNALFRKAWPKLLAARAVDAIAERTDKFTTAPPSTREVEWFLARGADPEPAATTNSTQNGSPNLDVQSLTAQLAQARERQRIITLAVDRAEGSQSDLADARAQVNDLENGLRRAALAERAPANVQQPITPPTQPQSNSARTGSFVLGGSVNSDAGVAGAVQVQTALPPPPPAQNPNAPRETVGATRTVSTRLEGVNTAARSTRCEPRR